MCKNQKDFIHKEFPKRFARDDFWTQIKRTVNGEPVSEEDICMIVDQIKHHMNFTANSNLLDIGCGNGALAARLFPCIYKYTGVDFSSYLLEIANEYFKPSDNVIFIEADAREFVNNYEAASEVNRILIYGCMSYFSQDEFLGLLRNIKKRFINVERTFIGNIPDSNMAKEFFAKRSIKDFSLDDNQSPIGVWWYPDELKEECFALGFSAESLKMPPSFYGHRYRFDLILK